jgi:hypothetical protein
MSRVHSKNNKNGIVWEWMFLSLLNKWSGYPYLFSESIPFIVFGAMSMLECATIVVCLLLSLKSEMFVDKYCCVPEDVIDKNFFGDCFLPRRERIHSVYEQDCHHQYEIRLILWTIAGTLFFVVAILNQIWLKLCLPFICKIEREVSIFVICFSVGAIFGAAHIDFLEQDKTVPVKSYKAFQKSGFWITVLGIVWMLFIHPEYNSAWSCYPHHNFFKYDEGFCDMPTSQAFQEYTNTDYYELRYSYHAGFMFLALGLLLWIGIWAAGMRLIYDKTHNSGYNKMSIQQKQKIIDKNIKNDIL